jgi:prepilin-type N-terminal cleavage/methylation domain-containing protein
MKTSLRNRLGATGSPEASRTHGFNLLELIVVVAVLALLVGTAMPRWMAGKERVMRAQCVANMRQIGVGLNMYSAEYNDYYPVCGLPSGQNPWQTYSQARVVPGTSTLTRGFMNFGLLFRTKTIPDPRVLYCPALEQKNELFSYHYYASGANGWPSTPPSGDDQIRAGYNYYPQLRVTEVVAGVTLPKLIFSSYTLEFGGAFNLVALAKVNDLDIRKSVASDLVQSTADLRHVSYNSVAGLNALFPDGRVTFQNARQNPLPFHTWSIFESGGNTIGNDGPPSSTWRTIMNSWTP